MECRYNNRLFQIQSAGGGYHLRHAEVTLCDYPNGEMEILYEGKSLIFKEQVTQENEPLSAERKELDGLFEVKILKSANSLLQQKNLGKKSGARLRLKNSLRPDIFKLGRQAIKINCY